MSSLFATALASLALLSSSSAEVINFKEVGGVSLESGAKKTTELAWQNGKLLNETIMSLRSNDVLYFPNE